jgi:hypothetical protein
MKRLMVLITVAMLGIAGIGVAGVPTQINIQGRLSDNGAALNGSHTMQFRMFDAQTGGNQIWAETQSLTVAEGLFSGILGQTTALPASLFTGQTFWLETVVDATTLTPRRPLVSATYSFRAQRADTADVALTGTTGSDLWSTDGANVWRPGGNVGIGTATPSDQLTIERSDTDPSNTIHTVLRLNQANMGTVGLQLSGTGIFQKWYLYRGWQNDFRIGTSATGIPTDYFRIDQAGNMYVGNPSDPSTQTFLYGRIQFRANYARGLDATAAGGEYGLEQVSAAQSGDGKPALRLYTGETSGAYLGFGRYTGGGSTFSEMMRLTQAGDLGLGTANPASKLDVAGTVQASSIKLPTGAASGYVLTSDATGLASWAPAVGSGAIGGSGTVNYLAKFNTSNAIGNSGIVDSGGLIGIGTTVPVDRLHVVGDVRVENAGDASIRLRATGAPNEWLMITSGQSSPWGRRKFIIEDNTSPSGFTDRLTIDSTGNVGLGTQTPASRLDVAGNARVQGDVVSTGIFTGNGSSLTSLNAASLTVGTVPIARMPAGGSWALSSTLDLGPGRLAIDGTGNVGIGTGTPSSRLDVAGTARVQGDVNATGTVRATSVQTVAGDALSAGVLQLTNVGRPRVESTHDQVPLFIGTNPSSAGKVLVIYRGDPTIASNELVQVFNNGEFTINGHLTVTGGKSAIVPTHLGMTKVYSQESPEVWFEDFGSGRLQTGQAEIKLDPTFLETVTIDRQHPLMVFVALEGECEGVYVLPGSTSFVVRELRHGHSNAPFTYRVVAKRRGFEDVRLEPDQAVASAR